MGQGELGCRKWRISVLRLLTLLVVPGPTVFGQTPPSLGYDLKTVSLTGPGCEYINATGRHRSAEFGYGVLNANGVVAGSSRRFSFNGADLGKDAWLFNGDSTSV